MDTPRGPGARPARTLAGVERVQRTDFATGQRAAVTRLGSGALRLDAAVTRVGVLQYSDGTRTWGELKLPEEVFAPESMATLAGLPVTVDHPPDLVTPETWDEVAVGHVGDTPRPERGAGLLVNPLVVSDAAAIAAVDAGDLVECSAGYTCELEPAEGTYDGAPYSAVQRRIVYNHVALGPEGWGRAGGDVKLRLNGGAVEVRPPRSHHEDSTMADKKKDGDAAPGACPPEDNAQTMDALRAENAQLKAALADALRAKTNAEAAAAAPQVTEEMVPPAVQDSIAAKRAALVDGVRAVLGREHKTDGKGAADLHREVVAKAFPSVKLDGLTADTVAGMARAAMETARASTDAARRSDGLRGAHPAPDGAAHNDAADPLADIDPRDALNALTATRFERDRAAAQE